MTSALAGRRILIPRAGAWGERVLAEVQARGGQGVIAPLIATRPPVDTDARDRVLAALAAGEYGWLFITSASTVEQLGELGVSVPAHTNIAAVGRATARALMSAGMHVDFVPAGQSSGLAMIRQWCAQHSPEISGRALVLRGDLAMASVSDELEIQGYPVDVGIIYRTIGVDLDPAVVEQITRGEINTVLLTSASVARELQQQTQPASSTLFIAIGPGTSRAAEKLGLPVHATADAQNVESMLDALEHHLSKEPVE